MTPQEQAQKLDAIAPLSRGEVQGWNATITGGEPWCRLPFPGEVAALMARAKRAGCDLALQAGHGLPVGAGA